MQLLGLFDIGVYNGTYTATDTSGNVAVCYFNMSVILVLVIVMLQQKYMYVPHTKRKHLSSCMLFRVYQVLCMHVVMAMAANDAARHVECQLVVVHHYRCGGGGGGSSTAGPLVGDCPSALSQGTEKGSWKDCFRFNCCVLMMALKLLWLVHAHLADGSNVYVTVVTSAATWGM